MHNKEEKDMNNKKKRQLNSYERLWLLFTIITIFLNIFVRILSGVISYGIYIALIVLTVYTVVKGKIPVRKGWMLVCVCLLISGIISSLRGNEVFGNTLNDVHQHFFFTIFMCLAICVDWNSYLSYSFLVILLKSIYIIGIIASLYALIFQGHYIPSILLENSYVGYTAFKSFFYQRNVFACMLFFSSIATLYLYAKSEKKRYIICLLLFGVEIYLASSRASLVAWALMICIYFYKKTRNKIFVAMLAAIFAVPMAYYVVFPLFTGLQHITSLGVSSIDIRFNQWTLGLEKLRAEKAFLMGLGMGSEASFLRMFVSYGSFHNVYLDIVFQGGVVKLYIYVCALFFSFKKITKMEEVNTRNVLQAAFIAYIVYSFVESDAIMFSNSYFSFLSTVLFCVIPQTSFKGISNVFAHGENQNETYYL